MPRRRLAFTANAGQPRVTINAAWLRLLPGPGGGGEDRDPDWYLNLVAHPEVDLTGRKLRRPLRVIWVSRAVPELQRLRADHAPAVLAFELANRVYFAASISDHGDEFFDRFTERHSALLAEQEAGIGAFYVLVAEDGLRTLKAATSRENAASQTVLARAGFIPVGPADPADIGGKQGTWYRRDLVQPLSSSLLVRGYGIGVVAPLACPP